MIYALISAASGTSLGTAVSVAVIMGGIAAGVTAVGVFARFGRTFLRRQIKEVTDEVSPVGKNGDGVRAGDALVRLETKLNEVAADFEHLSERVSGLSQIVDGHLGWHTGYEMGRKRVP